MTPSDNVVFLRRQEVHSREARRRQIWNDFFTRSVVGTISASGHEVGYVFCEAGSGRLICYYTFAVKHGTRDFEIAFDHITDGQARISVQLGDTRKLGVADGTARYRI